MVCKNTSTKRLAGFTLTEFLISIAVASIMFLGIGVFGLYSARSFGSIANYVDLDAYSRNALDQLTKDVRQVNRLVSSSSNSLVFEDHDGAPLRYVYSPDAKTLSRVKGGTTDILLKECDKLEFSIYQRNPIAGTYDQYPTGTAATAKLINVTWRCTRNIMWKQFNTESVVVRLFNTYGPAMRPDDGLRASA